MGGGYKIERMSAADVQTVINWAGREGWNAGIHDASTFYAADQNGFFKGTLDGEIVATGSAVIYDDSFAFCGLYIVAPEHRGKGYGLELTKARLAYCGDRNVGIDGVLANVPIYEQIGYVPYYENNRFVREAGACRHTNKAVRPITTADFGAIQAYDRPCFPAPREAFLKAWLTQSDSVALCYEEDGGIKGYGVRRKCRVGHKIGPLFADNAAIAEALFEGLQEGVEGDQIILDVPEVNKEAVRLAEAMGMEKIFATARMYQKGLPKIAYDRIFGVSTFELG
ncbi:MAG: GNAT family N-acetyltransferase [Alphaproteobacteria bacterium]|nr:GNAT family N-acetyltransferase [Alphaproteobacteria bacterium]